MGFLNKKNDLILDTSELSSAQRRLIRYLNSTLLHAVTTSDEREYFDGANEAMQMFASLIQQANFPLQEGHADIPYPTQALEFCMETMAEDLSRKRTLIFDN